ncbi:MAG: YdjY domain-containing protein [Thermogutta sp.]
MRWLFLKQTRHWLTGSALWIVVALAGVMTCGMITGCREPAPEGRSVSEPQKPRAAPERQQGMPTQAAASRPFDQAVIESHLGILIDASTEWNVGDDVSIPLTVSNDGEQTVDNLELRTEVQFGLQDSISEGRMAIPITSLPAKMSYHVDINFLSSRPGIWYVKAAIYHGHELIKATTRTLYIREATVQQQQQSVDDDDASLGPPLVDNPERLQRLHPEFPIWLDAEARALVMVGRVCQREAPLELFACLKNFKEHESVVSINTRAYIVHAGLLALGLEPGHPVQFYPEYRPATGPEVDIFVVWKDADGKIQRRPAQDWVRDVNTKQAMSSSWIFTGSQIAKDEDTGEQYYYADSTGELICVSNFPSAVLDLPIRSTDSNESLLFEAFTENIPPLGTPVTVILTPKHRAASGSAPTAAEENFKPAADEDSKTTDTPEVTAGRTDE